MEALGVEIALLIFIMIVLLRILNCLEAKININTKYYGTVENTIRAYQLDLDKQSVWIQWDS